MSRELARALGLRDTAVPPLVAFTGAGGKTSLLFALAAELGGKIAITTTTRLAQVQVARAQQLLGATVCRYPDLRALVADTEGIFLIIGPDLPDGKVGGVPAAEPRRWLAQGMAAAVLVEADGARMLPVKAPAAYEPVLPDGVTHAVPVVGVDAVGRRIAGIAHRPALLAALLRKPVSAVLTPHELAALLTHPQGGLKGVPRAAQVIPVLNKVQDEAGLAAARQAAGLILRHPRPSRVLLTAAATADPLVETHERVTAVVLAAGTGQRMGQVKQLLPWGSTTMLGQVLHTLAQTAVHQTVVVCGASAAAVAAEARAAAARTVFNPAYAQGEMLSSLQTAVLRLPRSCAAALVVLADQPLVEPELVDRLLQAFWQGLGSLIAPVFDGRRGNPVLIGRAHFAELLALPPGAAPRDLLRRHEVALVPAPSAAVLQDIDTAETYERLRPHKRPSS